MEEQEEITADIKNLTYEMVLSRHIDRILSLTAKEFQDNDSKIMALAMTVKFFKVAIPQELFKGKNFEDIEITSKEDFKSKFHKIQTIFENCVNVLAENGYLYAKIGYGGYIES